MATSSSHTLVAAFFNDRDNAENAVHDLQKAGFRSDQIGTSYEDYDNDSGEVSAATGSAAADHRSVWQKIEDFFSGEDRDRKNGAAVRNSGSDWPATGLAVPQRYRDRMRSGGELVSVRASGRQSEAEQILTRNNGQIENDYAGYTEPPLSAPGMRQGTRADITGGTMTPGIQSARTETTTQATDRDAGRTRDVAAENDERRIQLISEVLRVRKERVARGEVRLRKEVHSETQNVQVPVTREEIVIERNPIQGERTATGQIGADSEIRVPLSEERVQVDKVPVVTEEVRVAKRPVSETKTVRDQVRREELDVEGADVRDDKTKRTA